jgi:SAM-dependent methyltransferase
MNLQTDHPLVNVLSASIPCSVEERVIYLVHQRAYQEATRYARGCDVLDWGCNNGYGLKILTGVARRLAGLDTAEHCVRAARENVPAIASDIRLYTGQSVPFDRESFDLVVSFQVIEHVEDCTRYLRDIRSVLRPGGLALFTTPNRLLRLDPEMKPWNPHHVTEFAPATLHEMLARDFSRVELYGLHGSPELEAVERSRCARARQEARQNHTVVGASRRRAKGLANAALSTILGERLAVKVRDLRAGRRGPNALLLSEPVGELNYSQDRLDDALDLLAVCAS